MMITDAQTQTDSIILVKDSASLIMNSVEIFNISQVAIEMSSSIIDSVTNLNLTR